MALSWSDIDNLFPAVRTANTLPPLTPEEEDTLLRKALRTTGSALGAVGNLLDLPGSAVRDLVTGQNPFDQILSPFSSDNRATGRDVLSQFGMAENDPTRWELGDVLGFGVEVGLDPLTYMTFGGSALSKAGTAAKKAGLLDNLAGDATAALGEKFGRAIGPREARARMTIDDILSPLPQEARAAATQKLRDAGLDLVADPTLGQQQLGGWAKTPFGLLGTGELGAQYLRGVDTAAKAIAESGPGTFVRGLFDKSVGDAMTQPIQRVMPAAMRAEEKARQTATFAAIGTRDLLKQHLPETYADPAVNQSLQTIIEERARLGADPNALLAARGLPTLPEPLIEEALNIATRNDEAFRYATEGGVDVAQFVSDMDPGAQYLTRVLTKVQNLGERGEYLKGRLATDAGPSRAREWDWFGGTQVLNDLSKNPKLVGPDKLTDEGERVAEILRVTDQDLGGTNPTFDAAAIADADQFRDLLTWKPGQNAIDQRIKELAESPDYAGEIDAAALKEIVQEERFRAKGMAEFGLDFERYKQAIGGLKSPGWWKRLYDENLDAAAIPGFDLVADRMRRVYENPDWSDSDVLSFLRERGSPYNYENLERGKLAQSVTPDAVLGNRYEDVVARSRELQQMSERLVEADRARELSKALDGMPEEYATQGRGMFSEFVGKTAADYDARMATLGTNVRAIQDAFLDVAVPRAEGDVIPLSEAAKLVGSTDANGSESLARFLESTRQKMQQRGMSGEPGELFVPRKVALDAQRSWTRLQAPESLSAFMKVIDKVTTFTKDFLTLSPAFVSRNITSGHIQNFFHGVYDKGAGLWNAGGQWRAGKAVRGLGKRWPGGLTDEAATKQLTDELAALGVVSVDDVLGAPVAKPGTINAAGLGYGERQAELAKPGTVARDVRSGALGEVTGQAGSQSKIKFRGRESGKSYTRNILTSMLDPVGRKAASPEEAFGAASGMAAFERQFPEMNPETLRGYGKEFVDRVKSGGVNPLSRKFWDVWNPANVAGVNREQTTQPFSALRSRLNNYGEAHVRLPLYIHYRSQGYAPEVAAQLVKDAHVDYSQLSTFERNVMKRVMPFYSFQRRMGEYVARHLMEQPGGRIGQSIRAVNNARAEDNSYIPSYVAEGTAIPLSADRFITGLGLMHEGPFELMASGSSPWKAAMRTGEKLIASSNPLIRGPLEFITGKNFFTGRDQKDLYQFPFEPDGILGSNAKYVNLLLGNSPMSRQINMARGLIDERKGPVAKALNFASGLHITDLSGGAERAREFAARKAAEEFLADSPRARQFTNVYVPKEDRVNLSPIEADMLRLIQTQDAKARKIAAEKKKRGEK